MYDSGPVMGIGEDVSWHPGQMGQYGGQLYVGDALHRSPDDDMYDSGVAGAHVLRRVEILPDEAPPDGSAVVTDDGESAGTYSAAAAPQTFSVSLQATDGKTGRIPSGVRWFQVRSGGETTNWRPFQRTATARLHQGEGSIRFRDRAHNSSAWRPVRVRRSVTLNYSSRASEFRGLVSSTAQACESRPEVTVFRQRAGADERIGSTLGSSAGAFELRRRPTRGTYYARVKRKLVPSTAECLAAQSPGLVLR